MEKKLVQVNITSQHPHNRRSPRNEEWRRNIGAGVRRAKQQRKDAGLLSANDLAEESGLPRGTIISFMDAGALPFSQIGRRRYVDRTAWKRLRKALAQGGVHAGA